MKIYLVIMMFMMCISSIQAAYQYNTQGNQTWLTFDSNTSLYVDVNRSGKDNDHDNFIDNGNGIDDWGWYNLSDNTSGSFKSNNSVTFDVNDKIALWVKDNQGNIYNSTKEPDNFIWGKSDAKNDIFKIYGGNKGSNGSHEYYVFSIKTVGNNSNTPTGQPLPGIIATLIIGAGGIYYIKHRKQWMNI